MPKPKKSNKSSSSAASAATKKCTCDHPYNCECGNRPPRPSKGHKWDPDSQAWGGRGHKQKGASGQTASVSQRDKTTAIGKTVVAEWQRLPSQLLQDVCRKQNRPRPKYKDISSSSSSHKYRVILPDGKDDSRDLFFVPSRGVPNEEQSKEEAALLALFHVTPTLPHERKLPEPYRTTWLNLIEAQRNEKQQQKQQQQQQQKKKKNDSKKGPPPQTGSVGTKKAAAANGTSSAAGKDSTGGGAVARASTDLSMSVSYSSLSEMRKARDEKRRERNARIRRHEAVRMANQNHPVFMSAHIRKQIESLLRGDAPNPLEENDDDEEDPAEEGEEPTDDAALYVEERLHNEGFTRRQARSAYREAVANSERFGVGAGATIREDQWENAYDECLQWLLIHLNEDQLPEGFDPRGGTLDVVAPPSSSSSSAPVSAKRDNKEEEETVITTKTTGTSTGADYNIFASRYGISVPEARAIHERAKEQQKSKEEAFWTTLISAARVELYDEGDDPSGGGDLLEVAKEETEALQAIFPSECEITTTDGTTTVILPVNAKDGDGESELSLAVTVRDGAYPGARPERVIASGRWSRMIGAAVHLELVKFISTLPLGEPMIFAIHGQLKELLESTKDNVSLLLPSESLGDSTSKEDPSATKPAERQRQEDSRPERQQTDEAKGRGRRVAAAKRRPRVQSDFWSTSPSKTPVATAFPKIPKSMEETRKSLPAAKARAEFLALLNNNKADRRVVLVEGDTGCGKTTQIPQFILEESPSGAKIIVAQPRRLAATGVASRVASERGENRPGVDSVGYVVRGDSAVCKATRLLFCTTGVLLRQMQSEGALDCITHIVVDEVHERHLDTDVLLGLLKGCLATQPHLRVVLMSATLDAERFAAYWGRDTPRIRIPGRTFPVSDFMLEDVLSMTGYVPPKKKGRGKRRGERGGEGYNQSDLRRGPTSPWEDSDMSPDEEDPAEEEEEGPGNLLGEDDDKGNGGNGSKNGIPIEELVRRVDETTVNYDLLGQLVRHLVSNQGAGDDGSILVFLSGVPEINNAMETIKRCTKGLSILLLPLHGGLQPKEQNVVFDPVRRGITKVILSTNVAETSVTVPDCTVVVDTAREKQSSYDPANRMPLLLEQFACRASLKQRRGRAGRVRKGSCYRLISKATYDRLREHGEPEIRRCALDQTLLSLLFLGVERGPGTFLRTLLDPPNQESIEAAASSLERLGAVERTDGGNLSLTPLGMHLAGIPAPPAVGKILVMGSILGCRTPALAMAAGMSVGRSPFLRIDNPHNRRINKDGGELTMEETKHQNILKERAELFKTVGNSDHAMLAAAFMKWQGTETGCGMRKRVCDSLGLHFTGMREMLQVVNQLDASLAAAGYVRSPESDRNARSWRIVRTCAVSAMAPGQIVKVVRPAARYHETAEGAKERDGEARQFTFFLRTEGRAAATAGTQQQQQQRRRGEVQIWQEEKVFVHPSSANFSTRSYSCPWLVYHSMVRTSKPFLRDVTECSAYALLLFGGELRAAASEGTIAVDGWVKLSGKSRIVAMVRRLRERIDEQLARKVSDPALDIAATREMELVVKLLTTDGLGT